MIKKQIIIVDDSRQIRDSFKRLIKSIDNLEIIAEAENVQQAKEEIVAHDPFIVILDFKLPDGTALDIMRAMKQNCLKAKIIIYTLFDTRHHYDVCVNAGANYVFNKSENLNKLKNTLLFLVDEQNKLKYFVKSSY